MTIEQDIQSEYIKFLQTYKIDFVRIKNSAFKSKGGSPYTHAFNENYACHKFFPDIIFCHGGKVFLREFKERGKNPERQLKQEMRLHHWNIHGGCDIGIITSLEVARRDFQTILGSKYLSSDDRDQMTVEDYDKQT